MKPPPKKKENEMNLKELREYRRLKEAEAEADRIEQEEREKAILRTTNIQNSLVTEAERDIRIVKSKIDDLKEEYYKYDTSYDFMDSLDKLYGELATAQHKLQMIRVYPFNAPITTDTSNRNHDWYKEMYHEATNQYEDLRDNTELDKLNADLRDDNWGNAHNT
jgi:hypothetical protein